jgi:hypothetical protein
MRNASAKLRVHEIGPFVYREVLKNTNVEFHSNNSLSYTQQRQSYFVPEMSVCDPKNISIRSPNIALLTGYYNLANKPSIFSFAFTGLVKSMNEKPFIEMTSDELIWGYHNKLLRLGRGILPNIFTFDKIGVLSMVNIKNFKIKFFILI